MTSCSLWRCKQCGKVVRNTIDLKLSPVEINNILKSNGESISHFGPEMNSWKTFHKCDPQTIGLCELIGWSKTE